MIKIVYPEKKPSIKTENGKEFIFCVIRKRWLVISPEEWVRQNFLQYLIDVLGYPASLIAVEKQLSYNQLKKRFDIVLYKDAIPFMIVECKEMNVPLSESTILQVLQYNATLQAKYMVITNGNYCKGFVRKSERFEEIDSLPFYDDSV